MLCFFMDASLKEQALSCAKGHKVRVPTHICSSLINYRAVQSRAGQCGYGGPVWKQDWSSSSCYAAKMGHASCARPTPEPQESDIQWPEVSRCNLANTGTMWFLRSQGWGGCTISWGPLVPPRQSFLRVTCRTGALRDVDEEMLEGPQVSIFFS